MSREREWKRTASRLMGSAVLDTSLSLPPYCLEKKEGREEEEGMRQMGRAIAVKV